MNKNPQHEHLLAALAHSDLKEGEFVFRLDGAVIRGHLTDFMLHLKEGDLRRFECHGIIR